MGYINVSMGPLNVNTTGTQISAAFHADYVETVRLHHGVSAEADKFVAVKFRSSEGHTMDVFLSPEGLRELLRKANEATVAEHVRELQ